MSAKSSESPAGSAEAPEKLSANALLSAHYTVVHACDRSLFTAWAMDAASAVLSPGDSFAEDEPGTWDFSVDDFAMGNPVPLLYLLRAVPSSRIYFMQKPVDERLYPTWRTSRRSMADVHELIRGIEAQEAVPPDSPEPGDEASVLGSSPP